MKRFLVLFFCVAFSVVFVGCQESGTSGGNRIDAAGSSEFPEFLVGKWMEDRFNWGVEFGKDGSILVVHHIIWDLAISTETGSYHIEDPNDTDTFAYFGLGDCEADYDAGTRNLKVKIIMAGYIIKLPVGELTGRSDDYFEGPVSEDGKTWNAKWRGYGYLDDATEPDKEFVDAHPESLVFTKRGPDK